MARGSAKRWSNTPRSAAASSDGRKLSLMMMCCADVSSSRTGISGGAGKGHRRAGRLATGGVQFVVLGVAGASACGPLPDCVLAWVHHVARTARWSGPSGWRGIQTCPLPHTVESPRSALDMASGLIRQRPRSTVQSTSTRGDVEALTGSRHLQCTCGPTLRLQLLHDPWVTPGVPVGPCSQVERPWL